MLFGITRRLLHLHLQFDPSRDLFGAILALVSLNDKYNNNLGVWASSALFALLEEYYGT